MSGFWPAEVGAGGLLLALSAALAAGLLRGTVGFGGALLLAPVLGRVFSAGTGVALVLLTEAAGYLHLFPGAARRVNWRSLAPLAGAALAALPLGVYLLLLGDPQTMRRVIGVTVLLLSLLLLSGFAPRQRGGRGVALGTGALAGLLQGLTGTPGPPVVLYLYGGAGEAADHRWALIALLTPLDLAGLALFAWKDSIAWAHAGPGALLIAVSLLGNLGGMWLAPRVPPRRARTAALLLVVCAGLSALP